MRTRNLDKEVEKQVKAPRNGKYKGIYDCIPDGGDETGDNWTRTNTI